MANYDKKRALSLLLSQIKALENNVLRTLNDTSTPANSRYVSFKLYAETYNGIASQTETILGLSEKSFSYFLTQQMQNHMNTLWGTQKQVVEAVAVNISNIKTYVEDALHEIDVSKAPEVLSVKVDFNNKKVFIVHGHDHRLLDEVELMLRRINLEPVILKNETNSGRTIIEKIEDLTDVGFGIVLYTGCDEGRKKGDVDLKDRARQNVVFEHGYLCAKLGRNRVVALNDSSIEIPSDLSGVLYIPHSTPDWKNQLMREMRSAGLEFDPTKA